MNKTCPNCGKSFVCQDEKDCWCESAQINKKEMILIMDKFDDCLCEGCLGDYER